MISTALWWWSQYLLLGGRIRWIPLFPGALLCGAAVTGLGLVAQVYLPRAMSTSVKQFGPYGVVFTSLSWLIVVFTALTLAIALGKVVAEDEAMNRLPSSRSTKG